MGFFRTRPVGYQWFVSKYELEVVTHDVVSYVSTYRETVIGPVVEKTYPAAYWPGDTEGDHLEFAIKHEGVNLGYLVLIFQKMEEDVFLTYLKSKPYGKYARRLWFLYEFLLDKRLPLDDLKRGNYEEVLPSDLYYTLSPGTYETRYRVINNLLGDRAFCPVVKLVDPERLIDEAVVASRATEILNEYPAELLRRSLSFLYAKETKSSFEIERVRPDEVKTRRFMALLREAEHRDFCEKSCLLEAQNVIVEPRFASKDYREEQSYVGQTFAYTEELVHYICPPPAVVTSLMDGLFRCHERLAKLPAVVHAAVVSYAFVFFHPFDDGNGRLHRFLIHNILSLRGMVPKGLVFPVSATMLKDSVAYDASLERYSKPLMEVIDYMMDRDGAMTVLSDATIWYRYMNLTPQVEALSHFIKQTLDRELIEELDFLLHYDRVRLAMSEVLEMPDRKADLFVKVCLSHGSLSKRKWERHFSFLSKEEKNELEEIVKEGFPKRKF